GQANHLNAESRMGNEEFWRVLSVITFHDSRFTIHSLPTIEGSTLLGVATESRKNGQRMPRILIVDDDPGQRSLLDSFLRSQGFETVLATNGERALEILRNEDFNMMISDVRMPGISGLETLRRARQAQATLPVLLVTAYTDIREAVG